MARAVLPSAARNDKDFMAMRTALLVIDVQRGLCSGPYEVFERARVIERINLASAKARTAGAPVIFIQHEAAGGVLDRDGPGWPLAEGLQVEGIDSVVAKRTPDAFHQTALQGLLQHRGIEHLVICGLQSDFCVDTTTRRALALGYPVTLLSDGHSTLDNGVLSAAQISAHHTATLANITGFGPRVTPVTAAALRIEDRAAGAENSASRG
jgi:nicotinamidase-related amidase